MELLRVLAVWLMTVLLDTLHYIPWQRPECSQSLGDARELGVLQTCAYRLDEPRRPPFAEQGVPKLGAYLESGELELPRHAFLW